jgi:hypothetical protein
MYQINALLTRFFFWGGGGIMSFVSPLVQLLIFDRNKTKSNYTENLPLNRRSAPSVTFKLYVPCIVNWCSEYISKVIVKYIPYIIVRLLVLKEFVNQVSLSLVVSEIECLHKKKIHVNLLRRKQKIYLIIVVVFALKQFMCGLPEQLRCRAKSLLRSFFSLSWSTTTPLWNMENWNALCLIYLQDWLVKLI